MKKKAKTVLQWDEIPEHLQARLYALEKRLEDLKDFGGTRAQIKEVKDKIAEIEKPFRTKE